MAFWNKKQEIVPVVQGEVVQPGDEEYDERQASAYFAMKMLGGRPTDKDVANGAIAELARDAHLPEKEVRRRLGW